MKTKRSHRFRGRLSSRSKESKTFRKGQINFKPIRLTKFYREYHFFLKHHHQIIVKSLFASLFLLMMIMKSIALSNYQLIEKMLTLSFQFHKDI